MGTGDAPDGLREALAAAYAELFAALARDPDPPGRVHMMGEAVCSVTPGIDERGWALYLNQVSGLGLGRPATEAAVDDVVSLYRARRIPFVIAVEPAARPSAIGGWLDARGLRAGLLLVRSHRSPDAQVEVGGPFRVEDVRPEDAATFAALAGHGLPPPVAAGVARLVGRPGWRHSMVREGDSPVAVGALFVYDGMACLCWSATRPSHRRRGAHAALIRHRLRQSAELGCRHVVAETLEASPARAGASQRNLLRAGFQATLPVQLYVGR